MYHFNRFCHLFIILVGVTSGIFAQDVSFVAQAPKQVVLGKPFQLSYVVNQRGKDLRAPELNDFDLLAGPYTSTSSSTSFVNGKRTSTYQQTFTYTLMARREGEFTISPATIMVDGNRHTSNALRITVLPEDKPTSNGGASNSGAVQQPSDPSAQRSNSGAGSGDNLFVRTIVSKTKVSEQEALLLTYKLYFAGVDVAQLTNNTRLPEFTGFLKQEIELGERQTELEHYNDRNYQTFVLYQTLLYPQHAGDIKIDPASFEAVLRVQTRQQVRSIFDDFFGSYTNVTRAITAPGQTIHVEALPAGKPNDYSGAVGQFSLTGSVSSTDVKANEALTIKLVIKGAGNMKLIKTPAIDWPEGFEAYDPKVTNNFKTTSSGVSGTKSIEYLAIPRAAGEYTIPAITFSYFDIQEKAYKTLSTSPYTIHVQRGAGEATDATTIQQFNHGVSIPQQESIKQLGSDIRYIHTTELPSVKPASDWAGLMLAVAALASLLTLVLLLVLRRQIRENADLTRLRYKKANKVAQKRLNTAKKLLKGTDLTAFYAEIERAAWSYLSDRLSIPTAELNKENIADILTRKGVSNELIAEVKSVLSTAEFARYAPSAAGDPAAMYDAAAKLINQLEDCKL